MPKKSLAPIFILIFTFSFAQPLKLSPDAQISVITVAPGSSLNDAFGHNAIRIKDPVNNLNISFDYGRFDFEAPNFYLNFARGKLNYSIGAINYDDFLRFYKWQNRTVEEQVLNLAQTQKQKVYNYLINNYRPENRTYLYDFFFDNCATKIKDVINSAADYGIVFNIPKDFKQETFRALIQNNLNKNSWGSLGIDLALGAVIDKKATPEEHMFLPAYIHEFFESATINGTNKPLVKDSRTVYKQKETPNENNFFSSPLFIFGIIGFFILFITYKDYMKSRRTKWIDVVLFGFTGIIGILILLLWFATDHKATHQNYNLLWAFAINILVIRQLLKETIKPWFVKYLKFLVIMLCLLTLHWIIGVQVFAIGLIPLLIALFIRYVYLIRFYSSKTKHYN